MKNRNYLVTLFFVLNLFVLDVFANETTTIISAEQWAIPRHGERVVEIQEIRTIIQKWQINPKQLIEISYPGGENGELWLTELKDWIIALGISSANIKVVAGSGSKDIIKLTVVTAEGVSE